MQSALCLLQITAELGSYTNAYINKVSVRNDPISSEQKKYCVWFFLDITKKWHSLVFRAALYVIVMLEL